MDPKRSGKVHHGKVGECTMDSGIDRFIRLPEVAKRFGISKRGVWRAVARGELPEPCHIGRSATWSESEIFKKMQQLKEKRLK